MNPSAAYRYCRMRRMIGSSPAGSPRNGMTALAPECRMISSSPTVPFGKRTRSRSRLITRPVYSRRLPIFPGASPSGVVTVPSLFRLPLGVVHAYRPCVERSQRRLDHRRVPNDHELQLVRVEIAIGSVQHVHRGYTPDVRAVAVEVVGWQLVDGERRERPRDRVGGLVANRKNAVEIARRQCQLIL